MPRTATVSVLVAKALEIDEPDWCAGHHDDRAQYKVDITHYGPEHNVAAHDYGLFKAMLAQSPYAERASRDVALYIEQQDITGSYTPDEAEQLADALVACADQLRALGRELAAILAGGAR
ncbi:hypothetical protein JS756_03020 [Streptomyces actuosus]|uniref:Uncharacterized protein n=1 Tax=Streptomyces actuosus TaxID=1885 RepID=A0ABS2VJ81_STRAS|nr:hypothetical protein [Streptomyces actuosus]